MFQALTKILEKQPLEVSHSRIVEDFQQNLIEINSNKIRLENFLRNGINKLTEHCQDVRCDIDLATEKAIQDIQEKRHKLLKKVNDYEKDTILAIQKDNDANEKFEKTIKKLDQFSERWSSYLNKHFIDDTEVSESKDVAIELNKEADLRMKQLDAFIFNDKKLFFENNSEKSEIGMIKFEKISRKIDSLILSKEQELSLLSLIGFESKKFDLLWRGSRDGFGAKKFHSLCDKKGATLTVVKNTNGFIFGGFTSVSWTSCDDYKSDNKAFLFTLTNPSNMPLKLMNKGDQNSVYHHSNSGPSFGIYGYDLCVSSYSNLDPESFCFSGFSYQAPNGQSGYKGGQFIHGGGMGSHIFQFKTIEVEVFSVS